MNSKKLPTSAIEKESGEEFARLAQTEQPGIFAEFFDFLLHNKKWWISPILIVLFLVGLIIAMTASPIAPFIYPFF